MSIHESEIDRNVAEAKKYLEEAAEARARLRYGWLRFLFGGLVAGVTLFLFIRYNFLPLLTTDLELAERATALAELELRQQTIELKRNEGELADIAAQVESARAERDRLESQAKQLAAAVTELQESIKAQTTAIAASNQTAEQLRKRNGELEDAARRANDEVARLASVANTARRCRTFNVVQETTFPIPDHDYSLVLGDMTNGEITRLDVTDGRGSIVRSFANVVQDQELDAGDISLKFPAIEVKNLIRGVRDDSGTVTACSTRWTDGTSAATP